MLRYLTAIDVEGHQRPVSAAHPQLAFVEGGLRWNVAEPHVAAAAVAGRARGWAARRHERRHDRCLATGRHGERAREITVFGTTNPMLEMRRLEMGRGRYLPADTRDAPVCVLGAKVARELFAGANPLGETVRLGEFRFRVIGVLAPRGASVGFDLDEVVHLPVDTALRLFNRTSLFRVLMEVRNPRDMEAARAAALAVLTERHGVEDVTLITQDAVLASFNQIFRVLTLTLAGIAAVSLAVAGIGIMNVMLVSVSERTPEVGLLKALGAQRGQIVTLFLAEAALISTAGGLLGLCAGWGASRLLQAVVPELPASPPAWAVASALAVSVSVGLLFGGLPARRAAGLDPVNALMRRRA
ncbi:ABC transporter permease [bacterium]|nr:ABC transporter permease [bacterium]